jgi:hypothetical protein
MKWPWSKQEPEKPFEPIMGLYRMRSNVTGNRIDLEWEGNRLDAMAEARYRIESDAGKGIEFHGCPECGGFGHGSSVHR